MSNAAHFKQLDRPSKMFLHRFAPCRQFSYVMYCIIGMILLIIITIIIITTIIIIISHNTQHLRDAGLKNAAGEVSNSSRLTPSPSLHYSHITRHTSPHRSTPRITRHTSLCYLSFVTRRTSHVTQACTSVVPSKIKTHLILEEALVWFQTTTRLFDGSSELASCNN